MTAPEVTLRFLGGTAVVRGSVPLSGRAVQRRRIALLGILATAPSGTVARDRLIGLLWPEADTAAARDLLNTAVYDLRIALGEGSIRSVGDDLSLDAGAIRSDVAEFEGAVAAGDLERAVSLYQGPLLEGLFVSGAPEFERWLDSARERLRQLYRQVIQRMAGAAEPQRAAALRRLLALEDAGEIALADLLRAPRAADRSSPTTSSAAPARRHRRLGAVLAGAGLLAVSLLGVRYLPALSRSASERLAEAAAATTASADAARWYRSGDRHYRAARYLAASEDFRNAIRADPAFALAHYRLSQSVIAADLPVTEASAADSLALAHSADLPERFRLLILAWQSFRVAHPHSAIELYTSLVTLYPDDVDAWFQLGETFFHYNARQGRSIQQARAPFERVLALDPGHWSARWHLAHLVALSGDRAGFETQMRRLRRTGVEDALALEIDVLRAIARADRAAEDSLLVRLAGIDHLRLYQIAWRSAVFLGDLEAADRVARRLETGTELGSLHARGTQAFLSLARGRWRELDQRLVTGRPTEVATSIEARLLAVLHPLAPDTGPRVDSLHAAARRLPAGAEGDSQRLLVLERRIPGYAEFRRGDFAAAASRSVGVADSVPWFGQAVTSLIRAGSLARWIHAEALRELGRDSAALGFYASFGEHGLPDVALLAPARLRRGEIFEQMGRSAEAVREYQSFVELWRDADTELLSLVADVRRRISRLQPAG